MDPSGHAGPQCTARKVRAAQPRPRWSPAQWGARRSRHARRPGPPAAGDSDRWPPPAPGRGRAAAARPPESLDLAGNYVEAAGAESLAPALAAMTQGAQARRAWGQSPSTAASIRAFVGWTKGSVRPTLPRSPPTLTCEPIVVLTPVKVRHQRLDGTHDQSLSSAALTPNVHTDDAHKTITVVS